MKILSSRDDSPFVIAPQCLYEAYVVLTRPASVNGFDFMPEQAVETLKRIREIFELLPETPELGDTWQELAGQFRVSGKRAHDTRLVAFMKIHGIAGLLTVNESDFRPFGIIEVINPIKIR